MTPPSPEELDDAALRIERWLLASDIQLRDGAHRGGIAGWLDANGRPAFIYLEITGYYLTSMAWLLAGGARSEDAAVVARERGSSAVTWVHRAVCTGGLPATRIHLRDPVAAEWRNAADFTFDLAMAIRGLTAFAGVAGDEDGSALAAKDLLTVRLGEICGEDPILPSHRLRDGTSLPERWSTQRGPHHLKAAGALLSAPLDNGLLEVSKATRAHWARRLRAGWPVSELHPLLYGLEGLAMSAERDLDQVELVFRRLMQSQRPDGSLPAKLCGDCSARSDVLAQALRAGSLLRASGRLRGNRWAERVDGLAGQLLRYVHTDGSVVFAADQPVANAWCAMFALQALVLHANLDSTMAPLVRRYLV